ncbi:MAG: hypothetical protein GY888_30315 [Planctomycetaceae bacterium]|nr:hypothetical protein [Planctomycetaceae bacterium]
MPIKISCRCGQRFQAPEKLAGKKVRCPKCGDPLVIPTAGSPGTARQATPAANDMGSLLDEIGVESTPTGGKRCPQCNTTLAGQAVFCVGCGFNLETNEFVDGIDQQTNPDGRPKRKSFGNPLLDRAANELEYEKSQTQISQDPRSWYTYFIGLMLCAVFLAVGSIVSLSIEAKKNKIESDLPDPGLTAFWGVFAIGIMVVLVPWGQITYRAFRDKKLHGFLCLTFLYCPAYAIMQWKDLKRPFAMWIFGVILMAGSYGTYYYYAGDIPESLF